MNDPTKVAMTPEMQASVNTMISNAVRETMLALGPMFEKIALTPAKLAEAEKLRRKPDQKVLDREAREKALMKEDLDEARRNTERTQHQCTHKDKNMRYAISLIHNFPDRMARGICCHCHLLIEPTHWTIGAPDEKNPRGKAILVQAHELYHIVSELESTPQ